VQFSCQYLSNAFIKFYPHRDWPKRMVRLLLKNNLVEVTKTNY
jgi:hypothetical protein